MGLTHNIKFKPVLRLRLRPSDVPPGRRPLPAQFAHGFAIVAQTAPSVSRRLTGCYAPFQLLARSFGFAPVVLFLFSLTVSAEDTDVKNRSRVDIHVFAAEYANQHKKDVVLGPRVKGFVTLYSGATPSRITTDEFHLGLASGGYFAFEDRDTIYVEHEVQSKQRKLPFYDGRVRNGLAGHEKVTTLIRFKNRNPEEFVDLFKPLVESWGYVGADPGSKTLTVVTTVANVERLQELAAELDDLSTQ